MTEVKKHPLKDKAVAETTLDMPISAVAMRELEEAAETLRTLARPKIIKPERKKTSTDAFKSRILVISPYGQLNAFLDSRISDIVRGGYVDIINMADKNEPPYVDIAKREKFSPRPLWIIDFKKIMAMKPSLKHIAKGRLEVLASFLKDYAGEMPGKKEAYEEFLLANEISDSFIDKLVNRVGAGFRKVLDEKLAFEWKKSDGEAGAKYKIIGIVPFDLYDVWRKGKEGRGVIYLNPKEIFSITLEKRQRYDESGNFLSNAVSIADYAEILSKDLESIASGKIGKLVFFGRNY